eukprot:jgi/Astpho2/8528/fgenesh1_pg.00125_%23_32_t
MKVPFAMLALCALLSALRPGAAYTDTTKLASLASTTSKVQVNITSFTVNNNLVSAPQPVCTSQVLGSPCLVQLKAADTQDAVKISYNVLQTFPSGANPSIQMKACYSNFSQYDRPWRKANPTISLSKACPFLVNNATTKLPFPSGTATWHPPNTVPDSTLFIRAFIMCQVQGQPAGTKSYCAYGSSTEYFQVNKINTRPKRILVASIVISACCTILPKGSEEHMVSISNYAEAGPRSVAVVSLEQHSIVALAVKRNDYVCSGHRPCGDSQTCEWETAPEGTGLMYAAPMRHTEMRSGSDSSSSSSSGPEAARRGSMELGRAIGAICVGRRDDGDTNSDRLGARLAAMARCMSLYVEADAEPLLRTLAWCLALGPTDEGWGEDSIRWSHEFGSELGQQMANQLIRRSLSVGSTTAQHMEMLAEPSREGWLSLAPEQTPEDPGGEGAAAARDHTSGATWRATAGSSPTRDIGMRNSASQTETNTSALSPIVPDAAREQSTSASHTSALQAALDFAAMHRAIAAQQAPPRQPGPAQVEAAPPGPHTPFREQGGMASAGQLSSSGRLPETFVEQGPTAAAAASLPWLPPIDPQELEARQPGGTLTDGSAQGWQEVGGTQAAAAGSSAQGRQPGSAESGHNAPVPLSALLNRLPQPTPGHLGQEQRQTGMPQAQSRGMPCRDGAARPEEQTGPQQHALPARELDWDAILAREQELAAIPAPSDSSQTSAEEPALMPGLQQIPGYPLPQEMVCASPLVGQQQHQLTPSSADLLQQQLEELSPFTRPFSEDLLRVVSASAGMVSQPPSPWQKAILQFAETYEQRQGLGGPAAGQPLEEGRAPGQTRPAGAQARPSQSVGESSSPADSAACETQQSGCVTHWERERSRHQGQQLRMAAVQSRRGAEAEAGVVGAQENTDAGADARPLPRRTTESVSPLWGFENLQMEGSYRRWLAEQQVAVDLCALSLEAFFVLLRLVFQPGGWAWWDLAFLALKSSTISTALLARSWYIHHREVTVHLCALSGMLYYLATVQHHFKAGLYSAEDILHSPILFTRFVGAEVLCLLIFVPRVAFHDTIKQQLMLLPLLLLWWLPRCIALLPAETMGNETVCKRCGPC